MATQEIKCAACGAANIDDDLTVEPDGSRLCGKCWLKQGVDTGRFKVRDCKEAL